MVDASWLAAFVCALDGELAGLAAYEVEADECELVSLDAFVARRGVGTALLEAVAAEARRASCRRLWLITTNDNLDALRFYQRRGMRLVAVHAGAIAESRRLKPSISEVGAYGIPIRDELELELVLR
jgi:GNAT superfamily N-acetyltransferase